MIGKIYPRLMLVTPEDFLRGHRPSLKECLLRHLTEYQNMLRLRLLHQRLGVDRTAVNLKRSRVPHFQECAVGSFRTIGWKTSDTILYIAIAASNTYSLQLSPEKITRLAHQLLALTILF